MNNNVKNEDVIVLKNNRHFTVLSNKIGAMQTKKNIPFYLSICLLNICFLIIAWVIQGGLAGIIPFNDIMSMIEWRYVALIVLVGVGIVIVKSFVEYMLLRLRAKQRKFFLMLSIEICRDFYNCVSFGSLYKDAISVSSAVSGGVDSRIAIENIYNRNFFESVSKLAYTFLMIGAGSFFVFDRLNIFVWVLAIIIFAIQLGKIFLVLSFSRFQNGILKILAKICKLLYSMKIIKDYEKFYNLQADRLFFSSRAVQSSGKVVTSYVVSTFIVKFLKFFAMYLIFLMFDIDVSGLFFEIIFMVMLLDNIVDFVPLPNGTFIYEILFISLFERMFLCGYLLWAMVIYRLFDYFVKIIVAILFKPFELLLEKRYK